jgi:hypothetical protein
MAKNGKHKFCKQFGVHHEAGNRKCRRPLPDNLVPQTPNAGMIAETSDISDVTSGVASLITVVLTLATRMDNSLSCKWLSSLLWILGFHQQQLVLIVSAHKFASIVVLKRPSHLLSQICLHYAVAQANQMVDALDLR